MSLLQRFWIILTLLILVCLSKLCAEPTAQPTIEVKGAGFFKDRLLQKELESIFHEERTYFDPTDIEDAALIIISDAQNRGYLEAKTIGSIFQSNGDVLTVEWDKELEVFLPNDIQARSVEFELIQGPRFYYDSLEVNDSTIISKSEVEAYFYTEPYFFENSESKVFTPSLFASGSQNLASQLKIEGYQDAEVFNEIVDRDSTTGAVHAKLTLQEGPLHKLKQVTLQTNGSEVSVPDFSKYEDKPYNTFVRQDIMQEIRNAYYALGYSEVKISYEINNTPLSSNLVEVHLLLSIEAGPQKRISKIAFSGAGKVRQSLLLDQLTLKEGDYLNPSKLDNSRLNLARLGIFQRVDYELKEESEATQSLVFRLKERTTWELDALLGWGSFERLRLGLFAEKLNAFNLGHRLQFKSIISTKSLLGESRYLIPNFLETQYPLHTKLFYLEREELSFDREEFGITMGTSKFLEFLDLDMDAIYTFESLDANNNELANAKAGQDNIRSGSLEFRFSRDERDNPLNPQSGYRLFGGFEWGSESLGGQVDYQRGELGFSYHGEIKRGLLWHGAISHAVVGSFTKSQSQIPINKLLFPGGENSVRGYQRGGAAPKDINGDFLGAQSYLLLNLELEQRLTNTISVVGFFDALGMTADMSEYPYEDTLSSIGLGLRFRTFMGPIRLEYGYNLDQRIDDPEGTLHLTIGYPF